MSALFATSVVDDGVVSLCIATEDAHHMDPEWAQRLTRVLDTLGRDTAVRVVVLEGGPRIFCAGASRAALLAGGETPTDYAARLAHALLAMPTPLVAAMAGHAIGGGLVAGLWCDTAVLAEESLYGANFMALGFTPGMGATVAIPEAFGPVIGRELLYTGRLMTGREIRATGGPLASAVRPRDEVRDRARAMAREMAEAPRAALVLLKQTLAARRRDALDHALTAERSSHAQLFAAEGTSAEIARRYPRGLGQPGPTS